MLFLESLARPRPHVIALDCAFTHAQCFTVPMSFFNSWRDNPQKTLPEMTAAQSKALLTTTLLNLSLVPMPTELCGVYLAFQLLAKTALYYGIALVFGDRGTCATCAT